ncbi:MAG: hypothetical protein FWB86_13660 [Treponema sp.]|nr:hypothetical protein [Treponema sp.]
MKKKIIVALLILVAFVGSASAFDFMSAADGIKDSSIFVNIGVGIGALSPYEMIIPPLTASVEYMLPIGIPLSLGGFFSFALNGDGNKSTYRGYYQDTVMAFGLKGAWHIDLGLKNLDLYIHVVLGYMLWERTNEYTYWSTPYKATYTYDTFYYGAGVGVRFFFTDAIGVWLEAGYSALTFASLGLALKF